jgi:hypothetical protein
MDHFEYFLVLPIVVVIGFWLYRKVHLLERELGQPQYIAVGETTSSRVSREVTAMKLTPEQARRLAKLLEQAAAG